MSQWFMGHKSVGHVINESWVNGSIGHGSMGKISKT